MAREVSLVLPIYAGKVKKYLLSLNWYGVAHYRSRNTVKQEFHKRVGEALPKGVVLTSPISTHYKLYYKNMKSDANNVIPVIDKFLMDALQENNVIEEDNVKHYVSGSWEVIEQDRDNPRIEVVIKEDDGEQ